MNLSYWEEDTIYKNYDIVIIGAGFTGLWSALYLKEKNPSLKILIAEKNHYPKGASTRNAGFACFGSITELLTDSENMGWEKTVQLVQKRFSGLQTLTNYFRPLDFDLEICGGYELLNQPISQHQIELVNHKLHSVTGINETFIKDNKAISRFEFGNFGSGEIIFNSLEGSLHPGKLTELLIRKCYEQKINFLWGNNLSTFHSFSSSVRINLSGTDMECGQLLICTNGFTHRILPQLNVKPARGQVLLTSEIPGLKVNGVFHSDEGYIYFRNLGNRILLGGMRNLDFQGEQSDDFKENTFIIEKLKTYLHEVILPRKKFQITHQWTGIMGMGKEKNYLLNQSENNIFYAVRLSGMGVALAPKIGEEAAALLLNKN